MPATEDAALNPVRQVVETAWREYNRGFLEHDRAQMLALMAQAVAMGSPGASMIVLEATASIAELAAEGSQAIAVMANKYCFQQGDAHGWYGAKDVEHKVETVGRWRQTWVKTDQGWQLQVNQRLSIETYVDGVLFAPAQGGTERC